MIPQVRPSELNDWLAQQQGAPLVLDVREDWELQTASIQPDAAFEFATIPMNDVPARLNELDPQRPIAILCHTGRRSQRVAMFLAEQGYGQVANIAGGIEAWANERDPSVPHY
jgi:rhodanese-related sulfurtransferase